MIQSSATHKRACTIKLTITYETCVMCTGTYTGTERKYLFMAYNYFLQNKTDLGGQTRRCKTLRFEFRARHRGFIRYSKQKNDSCT